MIDSWRYDFQDHSRSGQGQVNPCWFYLPWFTFLVPACLVVPNKIQEGHKWVVYVHCLSYHFSRNPIKSFFQIYEAKIVLLSFSSKLLLHLSYNRNGISGSFTFHKSKLHVSYINLLPNSGFALQSNIISKMYYFVSSMWFNVCSVFRCCMQHSTWLRSITSTAVTKQIVFWSRDCSIAIDCVKNSSRVSRLSKVSRLTKFRSAQTVGQSRPPQI